MTEKEMILKTIREEIKSRKIIYAPNKITIKQKIIEVIKQYYNDYPNEDV